MSFYHIFAFTYSFPANMAGKTSIKYILHLKTNSWETLVFNVRTRLEEELHCQIKWKILMKYMVGHKGPLIEVMRKGWETYSEYRSRYVRF